MRANERIPRRYLFVCVENACRSQMAEAFARLHGGEEVEAFSAGSDPAAEVNPTAVEVMRERGVDLAGRRPSSAADLPELTFDAVVSMGCGDRCPSVPARRRLEWDVPDPKRMPADEFRRVRDEVERRVLELLREEREEPEVSREDGG